MIEQCGAGQVETIWDGKVLDLNHNNSASCQGPRERLARLSSTVRVRGLAFPVDLTAVADCMDHDDPFGLDDFEEDSV